MNRVTTDCHTSATAARENSSRPAVAAFPRRRRDVSERGITMTGPKRPANWGTMSSAERKKWLDKRRKEDAAEVAALRSGKPAAGAPEKPKSKSDEYPPEKTTGATDAPDDEDQYAEDEDTACETGTEIVLRVNGQDVETTTLRAVGANLLRELAELLDRNSQK